MCAFVVSLFLVAALLGSAEAPAESAFSLRHQGISFDVYRLDEGEEQSLRFFWKRPDGSAYATIAGLQKDLQSRAEQLLFATNGGIYSRALTPLGLYVEGGQRLAPLSTGRGGGNFFLKPNGRLLRNPRWRSCCRDRALQTPAIGS